MVCEKGRYQKYLPLFDALCRHRWLQCHLHLQLLLYQQMYPPSTILSSVAVEVTPSMIFNSEVVAVTPSIIFNSAAVAVTPSRIFNSAAVAVTLCPQYQGWS